MMHYGNGDSENTDELQLWR